MDRMAETSQPAVRLATADCTVIELIGNRVYGGAGEVAGGAGRPLVARDNTLKPFANDPPHLHVHVDSARRFRWLPTFGLACLLLNCSRKGFGTAHHGQLQRRRLQIDRQLSARLWPECEVAIT